WHFSRECLPAEAHLRIANLLFHNQNGMTALLKAPGLDKLVEFLIEEQDAAVRGRLLASLVSSNALRQPAVATQAEELARRLLDNLPADARQEYLRGLFRSNVSHHYISKQSDLRERLWKLA